jgi:hypothetical protein
MLRGRHVLDSPLEKLDELEQVLTPLQDLEVLFNMCLKRHLETAVDQLVSTIILVHLSRIDAEVILGSHWIIWNSLGQRLEELSQKK